MIPFTKFDPTDTAELKALLFALLFCGLFITLLSVAAQPSRRKRVSNYIAMPANKLLDAEPARLGPLTEKSRMARVVPENFKYIDFKNLFYAVYELPTGKEIELTLYNGELRLPDNLGWFSLKDVYYNDVTGDGKADAIVRLSHVACGGGSCDGGAEMFYIYGMRNGVLQTVWQYETGSQAYGCSLKSFTASRNQLVLELFGRCPYQATGYPSEAKYVVKDLTYILFEFDGRSFVRKSIEFFPTISTNVKSYEPAIRLF